jgi:hypothetical protein
MVTGAGREVLSRNQTNGKLSTNTPRKNLGTHTFPFLPQKPKLELSPTFPAMSSTDTESAPALPADSASGGPAEKQRQPVAFRPTREFLLAFLALDVIIIAVALDATTLAVALPIMSSDLGGSALEAFWSGTSFLLASTVFQPTFASLSSIFGRKAVCLPVHLPS